MGKMMTSNSGRGEKNDDIKQGKGGQIEDIKL